MELGSKRVDQPIWTRTLIGWHVVFWVLLAMTLVVSFSGDLGTDRRIVYTAAVLVLGAAYQFVGRAGGGGGWWLWNLAVSGWTSRSGRGR